MGSQKMIGIPVPVIADPVAGPTVTYSDELTSIDFFTQDDKRARVTFEYLNSIRVSRGEYAPYATDWNPGEPVYWVSEVVPSSWLRERYEYEKAHYGEAYEWSGDVDEMLRDFSHYVFRFHDEYVEALSAGIWFETFDHEELSATHPLRDLPRPSKPDLVEVEGITCEIWPNTRPLNDIIEDAQLCSQKLFQFATVFDGYTSVGCTLSVRVRRGKVHSSLKPGIGRVFATFDGIATLENARPNVESWLREIKKRRRQMGKA